MTPSPARALLRTPHMPWVLVAAWLVLTLPALLMVGLSSAMVLAPTAAAVDPTGFLFLGASFAAIAATIGAYHAPTGRGAGLLATAAVALLLVLALPVTFAFGSALTEEWCESQPGGRGGAPITWESPVPRLCR